MSYLSAFHTVHGIFKAGILNWFAISFSSGPCFVRTFHHDPSWVALHGMSHSFIELDKAVVHEISLNILFYHNSIPNLFGGPGCGILGSRSLSPVMECLFLGLGPWPPAPSGDGRLGQAQGADPGLP